MTPSARDAPVLTLPDPRIEDFLREEHDAEGFDAIEIVHVATPSTVTHVRTIKVPRGDTDPHVLATRVWRVASDDAGPTRGDQVYAVNVLRGETRQGRQQFAVRGSASLHGDLRSAENDAAQRLLETAEGMMRLAWGETGNAVAHYRRALEIKDARTDRLESTAERRLKALEEALDRSSERQIATKEAEARIARSEAIVTGAFGALNLFGPAIANRVVTHLAKRRGEKVSPLGALGVEQLKALVSSIKGEQIEALSGVLTKEQMTTLLDLYSVVASHEKERKKKRKKKKTTTNAAPPPTPETPPEGTPVQ